MIDKSRTGTGRSVEHKFPKADFFDASPTACMMHYPIILHTLPVDENVGVFRSILDQYWSISINEEYSLGKPSLPI